jgi:2,4-dienoyl-CoA reductase-like NADH-dependent reductase (Old Yellow Enzyme family)
LSPYSNKRTDAYGGSPENRSRLIVEIIEGIRAELKDTIAISLRISGDEFVDGGLHPQDFQEIVPRFEKAGMDMLNIAAGVYASMERIVPPKSLKKTPHINIARQIKQFTHVPVCAVGSILSLDTAEAILAEDKADLCAMGRAQVADPAIVKKSLAGNQAEIRKCLHCNNCTFWTTGDPYMMCSVNPDYQN